MNFAIEDSADQSSFRTEVRAFLDKNMPAGIEFMADPCDMSFEQYQLRRDLGRKLGAKGWLYPSMPKQYGGGDLSADDIGHADGDEEARRQSDRWRHSRCCDRQCADDGRSLLPRPESRRISERQNERSDQTDAG